MAYLTRIDAIAEDKVSSIPFDQWLSMLSPSGVLNLTVPEAAATSFQTGKLNSEYNESSFRTNIDPQTSL